MENVSRAGYKAPTLPTPTWHVCRVLGEAVGDDGHLLRHAWGCVNSRKLESLSPPSICECTVWVCICVESKINKICAIVLYIEAKCTFTKAKCDCEPVIA